MSLAFLGRAATTALQGPSKCRVSRRAPAERLGHAGIFLMARSVNGIGSTAKSKSTISAVATRAPTIRTRREEKTGSAGQGSREMTLEFVVRVWDLPSKKLLFEGASDKVSPEKVVGILGLPADDPEIWGAEYEATSEQGGNCCVSWIWSMLAPERSAFLANGPKAFAVAAPSAARCQSADADRRSV
ncbi:hypothetical protein ACVWZK_003047 [Bradyrhizobium sp. GM0.4]